MTARPRAAGLRLLLAGLACALAMAVLAPSAGAHATLLRSDPSDGAVLEDGPSSVRLWFTEEIVARFSSATLREGDGTVVTTASVRADATDGLTLALRDDLPRGIYSIDWKVLSAEDGHFRGGLVVFAVGLGLTPVPAGDEGTDGVGALDVLLRWLNLSALAGLVGGLAVAGLVLTASLRASAASVQAARHRVLGWTLGCSALGLAAGIGLLFSQARSLAPDESLLSVAWDFLAGTRLGAVWIAREGILLALFAVLILMRRGRLGRLGLPGAALLAVAAVCVQALAGHANAVSPQTPLAVGAAVLHGLAAGLWIGGLAAVTVAIWPFGRGRRERAALAGASLRRFGALAALGVATLGVTGLYYAGRQVASVDALLTTLYGQTLLVKLGLVLVAGLLGLLNALLLRPPAWSSIRPVPYRPLLLAEVGAGLAVLVAVGVLTAAAPARGPEFAPAPAADPPGSLSTSVDDLVVTLAAKPNRAGHNVFQAIVASTRRPAPAEIESVTLRFSRDGKAALAPMVETEPGRFRVAGDYLDRSGDWRIGVIVRRTGLPSTTLPYLWTAAPEAGRPVLVSDRPLRPILTNLAFALLTLLAVLGAFRFRPRARRRLVPPEAPPLENV